MSGAFRFPGWQNRGRQCGKRCREKTGRSRKEDPIDHSAGLILRKKYGDPVQPGDVLAVLRTSDQKLLSGAAEKLRAAYQIGREKGPEKKLVYARVTRDGIERF